MKKKMKFSGKLIQWYLENNRELPWRFTIDPYKIWLSEIILQQTRIDQGLSYYEQFIKRFPTVNDLSSAKEDQVLKLWQGLGYYSRARNLHYSAQYIVNELGGVFPSNYNELIKLKGVGDYTASAIASICFDKPTAVVDGNVYRVLARYFGIETTINSSKGIKEFKSLAQKLIDKNMPGTHNQAVMEFGARMCKPQKPNCFSCTLNENCFALSKNKIQDLPVKENKIKIKKRYFNYLVIHTEDQQTKLLKRINGIWTGLYEFPLIESLDELDVFQLMENKKFIELLGNKEVTLKLFNNEMTLHKLTHQHIYTKFWVVNIPASIQFSLSWKEIEKYPVPTLIHNFLEKYLA